MRSLEVIQNDKSYYKFVVGDFNTWIRKSNEVKYRIGNSGIVEKNGNGDCLLEFLSELRLFHRNLFFRNNESRRWK